MVSVSSTFTKAHQQNCPGNLEINQVIANRYNPLKYYKCYSDGNIREHLCEEGLEFDSKKLVCNIQNIICVFKGNCCNRKEAKSF